jgi:hypothetical protein
MTKKRAEVRLLEFYDIPGITFSPQLAFAQKIAGTAKKRRVEVPPIVKDGESSSTHF